MSRLLHQDLDTTVAKFHFLCTAPTHHLSTSTSDPCPICQEPYRMNDWEPNGTVHHPVTLPCGHMFGLQCLARWITSTTYVNNCPLCRKTIIDTPRMKRERLLGPIASAFARLETVAVVECNGISKGQRERLFRSLRGDLRGQRECWGGRDGGERVMVAWEEFYNILCEHTPEQFLRNPDRRVVPTAPGVEVETRRQGQAVRTVSVGDIKLVFCRWQIRLAMFVAMIGVVCGPTAFIYDDYTLRTETFSAYLWAGATCVVSLVAGASLALAPGMPEEEARTVWVGMLAGVLLAVGMRKFEVEVWNWGVRVVMMGRAIAGVRVCRKSLMMRVWGKTAEWCDGRRQW